MIMDCVGGGVRLLPANGCYGSDGFDGRADSLASAAPFLPEVDKYRLG